MTRIGIIGAGRAAAVHAEAVRLARGVTLMGFAGSAPDSQSARHLAAVHHVRAFGVEELLDISDAVVVATPPSTHRSMAAECAVRELPALIESPIAPSRRDAHAIEPTGVLSAANLLHAPAVRTALTKILEMHEPHHLELHLEFPVPTWGCHGRPDFGAGVILDPGAQLLPLLLTMGGAPVSSVRAEATARADGIDTAMRMLLRFSNGRVGRARLTWGGSTARASLEAADSNTAVRCDIWPTPVTEIDGRAVASPDLEHPLAHLGFGVQIERLIQLTADRVADPWPGVAVGASSVTIAVAAADSAARGTEVSCEDLPFASTPASILATHP